MTSSSTNSSLVRKNLTNLSRSDILAICEKYRNDKDKLRLILRSLFAKPENISLFGWFINRKYFPLESPAFHKEMLLLAADTNIHRLGIVAPRGHAKSTILDYVFPMWSACYRLNSFTVIVSDTYTQAEEFVNALRDEFESNPIIKWLYGDMKTDEWKSGEFVLANGTKFIAKGSGMKLRGIRHRFTRPDLMIFDDIENDENIQSADQRAKLYRWFKNAAIPSLSRDGRVILIGTILHFDSLVNKIVMRKSGEFEAWTKRAYYAITEVDGEQRALWEEHRSLAKLIAMRDDPADEDYIGSITFAQEYMHKPFNEEDAIVRPDWIQEIEPAMIPQKLARVMTLDPAASERAAADPSAIVIADLGVDGNVYVRQIGNSRMSPKKTAARMKDWNEMFVPNRVGVENGALGLVFRDLLAGLPVVGLKPDADKVRRLISVSRFFEGGQVFIEKGIKNAEALRTQLIEFPKSEHDDMVDALVYAIRMLKVDYRQDDEDEVAEAAGGYGELDDSDGWDDDDDY